MLAFVASCHFRKCNFSGFTQPSCASIKLCMAGTHHTTVDATEWRTNWPRGTGSLSLRASYTRQYRRRRNSTEQPLIILISLHARCTISSLSTNFCKLRHKLLIYLCIITSIMYNSPLLLSTNHTHIQGKKGRQRPKNKETFLSSYKSRRCSIIRIDSTENKVPAASEVSPERSPFAIRRWGLRVAESWLIFLQQLVHVFPLEKGDGNTPRAGKGTIR